MSLTRRSQCGAIEASTTKIDPLHSTITPGTRHHKLLTTNDPPEDSDIPFIRSAISAVDAHLLLLDADITRLRDRVKQLEEERASLSRFRAQNHAIVSPLRRIPPEVFSEIFTWSLPSVRDSPRRRRFCVTDSPWNLSHVCRRWRSISISNPSLWSLMAISYYDDMDPLSSYPLSMVETQLARARKLKIHFYGSETSSSHPQVETFKSLAKHSSLWEELNVQLTSQLVPLLANLRDGVPLLRRLWIAWDEADSQAGVQHSIDGFGIAPSLLDATIYNQYRSISFLLPAHNLTRYQLDGPWKIHQSILKLGSTKLIEAHITIQFDNEPWPKADKIIDLVSLRRLFGSHLEILNYLRTPQLEEIAVEVMRRETRALPTRLKSLVLRSLCPLRSLCLAGITAPLPTAEILDNIPSIVELAIVICDAEECEPVDDLLSLLAHIVPVVAPQLRGISFSCTSKSCINYDLYLAMLKSRRNAESCALEFTTLLLGSRHGPDQATSEDLDVLLREGLDVTLIEGEEAADTRDAWLFF